jgi:7-carboxy-7-deazaguanine synthase
VLRINDIFWTIQGEGSNAGRRALFIRLPYCNYKCTWCDTSFNTYEEMEIYDFAKICSDESAKFAVITGGEPLMNKQTPEIVSLLKMYGFEIACESNGSMPAVEGIDCITVSPKRDVQKGLPEFFINPAIEDKITEIKYVVDDGFDFAILDRHKSQTFKKYLSPEYGNFQESVRKIENYIKENPEWRVSLQTHKWMNIK